MKTDYGFGIESMLAKMTTSANSTIEPLLARGCAARAISWRALSGQETDEPENRYQPKAGKVAFAILSGVSEPMADQALPSVGTDLEDRADAAYRNHYALLHFIAARRFGIPEADAENVVHDVFVRFLRHRNRIMDDRSWLVAAVCNASRDFWRAPERREEARVPEQTVSVSETLVAHLDVATLMGSLPEKCRNLLRRKFCDGCSSDELAVEYETTSGYAKLMVHRCLTAARALLVRVRRIA